MSHSIKVGDKDKASYNSKTKRMCPADFKFTTCTFILVLVPTFLCYMHVIILNKDF